jgi:uncharacterized protein YfaT (DUF1175 family)
METERGSERGVRATVAVAATLLVSILVAVAALAARDHSTITPAQSKAAHIDSRQQVLDTDRFGDGTPDFLRLDDPADRDAFRRWFTLLAEAEAAQPAEKLPPEINDCAGLIRFAYREALRSHDPEWMARHDLRALPGVASVEKYQYPFTPLGAALWRVQPGSFQAADLSNGAFAQFADAKTLKDLNMHFIGKDLHLARPGDVLFYRQPRQNSPYHSMIFVGRSQLQPELQDPMVIYHTGAIAGDKGEIRFLRVPDLMNFPSPRWRPLPENQNFLGAYRWNILREAN